MAATFRRYFCAQTVGIFLVAIGVSVEVLVGDDLPKLAGEGLVLAVCNVFPIKFGNMKVCFDCALVATAVVIGLVSQGSILGVREGTAAAAIFVGIISKQLIRLAMKKRRDFNRITVL